MYANWLTTTAREPHVSYYPGASASALVPQPDVLLEVGVPPVTSRFWAHSQVICQYSGYLRSAVTTARSPAIYATSHEKPIFIPSVTVDQFQPLLRYMYSGFLDLSMDNIFAVLLATHVLHMPHALEICRSFLSRMQAQGVMPTASEDDQLVFTTQSQQQQPGKTKQLVIKPIPNKAKQMSLLEATISCPSAPQVLVPSSGSTFHTLLTPKDTATGQLTVHSSTFTPLAAAATPQHSTTEEGREKTQTTKEVEKRPGPPTTTTNIEAHSAPCGKAVLDIASCDGPVRFRRVLNRYYNSSSTTDPYHAETASQPITSHRIQQLTSSSFHRQMVRDINERRLCDETSTSTSQDTDHHHPSSSNPSATCYKCTVCKHTFKSEYCYVKHSKRHLIPLVDRGAEAGASENAENSARVHSPPVHDESQDAKAKAKQSPAAYPPPSTNREVIRPLDMNVQYYPCKTCGSKFPSYYFVHKHRKLCHPQLDNHLGGGAHENATGEETPPLTNFNESKSNAEEDQL